MKLSREGDFHNQRAFTARVYDETRALGHRRRWQRQSRVRSVSSSAHNALDAFASRLHCTSCYHIAAFDFPCHHVLFSLAPCGIPIITNESNHPPSVIALDICGPCGLCKTYSYTLFDTSDLPLFTSVLLHQFTISIPSVPWPLPLLFGGRECTGWSR